MSSPGTLYKKTKNDLLQYWNIRCEGNEIITTYGQIGTENPQETRDTIREGKNIGKKTETTPTEQAYVEMMRRFNKQLKNGYCVSRADAEVGKESDLIEGGIKPMLAEKFSEHGDRIVYPAYAQPKLDGHRCIAIIQDGKCELWSRQRKRITSVPHIIAALEANFKNHKYVILDGELYNHDLKAEFEKLSGLIRRKEPQLECYIIQYHVYDVASGDDWPFSERTRWLTCHLDAQLPIVEVFTAEVKDESELMGWFDNFTTLGYEGAIVRNAGSTYQNRRTSDLQKIKEFDDAEFEIIGISEGRGRLQGHAACFVCLTAEGKQFEAKMKGETSKLKEYWEDHSLWKGRHLIVKYQGMTKNGVPRFPVGLRFKEYV